MFFRMLKKDMADKKGLNIILWVFMCFSSILTVCSAIVLYVNIIGHKQTLERVNAADVTIVSVQDMDNTEATRKSIMNWLSGNSKVEDAEAGETIVFYCNAIDFEGVDEGNSASLIRNAYFAFDPSIKHNTVTDMDGNELNIPYGGIALPMNLHTNEGSQIGDKVRIVTQMGNIYEFTVTAFFKDPSMDGWYRLFFNEEDYAILKSESPVVYDVYLVDLKPGSTPNDETVVVGGFHINDKRFKEVYASHIRHGYDADRESEVFLNIVMILGSIFLIVMVFMTVSFTIKTAIRNEEKELGMLKALGVESVSFNWLFAAKYLVISGASSVVGFFGGIQLAAMEIKYFSFENLKPPLYVLALIAFFASLFSFGLIIIFVSISLQRMKRISIMDVIAGENRGERFKAFSGLFLHKIKHVSIPFYLAITDLTTRIKRYSFLIVAYTMAITMMLVLLEVNATVNSKYWMMKYWALTDFDFALDLPDNNMEKYVEKGGSTKGAYIIINEEIEEAGIPAKVDYFCWSEVTLHTSDKSQPGYLQYHIPEKMKMKLYDGVAPKLRNEILMDAYHAKINGIKVGDSVRVEYFKYKEDGISSSLVTEEFIVTGLLDEAMAEPTVFMSNAFNDAARFSVENIGGQINAPDRMKGEYIKELRDMYGQTSIRTDKEEVSYRLHHYKEKFDLLLKILIPMMTLMLVLVTVLYQSVNVIDEKPDIALLKCSGFTNGSVKVWQVIRSVMISGIASVLSVILLNTVILLLLQKALFYMGSIVQYIPNRHILLTYILLPGVIIAAIAFTIYFTLGGVKNIELNRIRED